MTREQRHMFIRRCWYALYVWCACALAVIWKLR